MNIKKKKKSSKKINLKTCVYIAQISLSRQRLFSPFGDFPIDGSAIAHATLYVPFFELFLVFRRR